MKITLFTLDMRFEDDTPERRLDSPFHQFCKSTWDRILEYLTNKGYEAELVIYTNESEEFKLLQEEVFKYWTTSSKAHYADVFRMYILSKYPNHMWLDWDVFIKNTFEIDLTKPYLMHNWFIVYNADNLDLFGKIYNQYKITKKLQFLADRSVTEFLLNSKIIDYTLDELNSSALIHCYFLDNNTHNQLYFITDEEEDSEFVKEHIVDKHNYRFINPISKSHKGIKGLHKEKELIVFILNNFELSEHSRDVLEDALNNNYTRKQ